ncbi:MAG: anthranilate synthase component I, partial [Candidatus Udaeobacter sp.]
MKPQITPNVGEVSVLARRGNVVPIFAEFIADNETPVSAFKKLDASRMDYSFLFESTEKNDVSGRFSFVGINPRIVIKNYGRELQIVELGVERRVATTDNPLDQLRRLMARYQFVSRPELPRFSGGAVGFLGYEAIHFFEPKVPVASRDELQLPEAAFVIPSNLLIFDHRLRTLKIVANVFLEDGSPENVYARAVDSIDAIARTLTKSVELSMLPTADFEPEPAHSKIQPKEFIRAVERAQDYIRAG